MSLEEIEKSFYNKHPNYKPYLRMLDYEGNEIKFCDVIYDYHNHINELKISMQNLCMECRTQNFCRSNFDKPCHVKK